jgi:Subtilase family
MNCSTCLGCALLAAALSASGGVSAAKLTATQTEQIAQDTDSDVIVIMRDQLPGVPPTRDAMAARAAAIAASHGSIVAELKRVGAKKVREFSTINAIATTVSRSEVSSLEANPLVQAVIVDAPIGRKKRFREAAATAGNAAPAASTALCNTLEPQALQLTNTAFLDSSVPQAQLVRDGNGQLVTGKGVKVAVIFEDGLDPTIPGFTRADGSPVFIDYQNFSGDPAGTPTAGSEAFLDASSIGAQDEPNGKPLTFDISLFASASYPLPSPCNIRIRGMAPGASLIGVQLTDDGIVSTTSDFVRGIDYAVNDGADVIDETFATIPFPDTHTDPVSLANAAAVAAGVTVVAITGDAGSASTIYSTGADPEVIAVGATTSYRAIAQLNDYAFPLSNGEYLSNNISSLSSGGFTQVGPRTVDVVAPGDLGWSLCGGNPAIFLSCTYLLTTGGPAPVELAGGTSEAAPFTAGEAALVIQAYRSTHRGNSPSPALVKQIIMSTATDLGAPASEQGAGLINSLAAVNLALSIQDDSARPIARGRGLLLYSPTSASVVDMPGSSETRSFTVTNVSATRQHVAPTLQTLSAPFAGAHLSVALNPVSDATFVDLFATNRPYVEKKFYVPAGAQHLDAAIAWRTPIGVATPPLVDLSLLDPSGRFVTSSDPQGLGSGYGHVDVVHPAFGIWTAIIASYPASNADSYSGPVQFTWGVEAFSDLGTVIPASFDLAPGATQIVTALFRMPSQPGDSAAAIRFGQVGGPSSIGSAEIPVTLRTLIPVGSSGGSFSGTLTGGNGRPDNAPNQTFEFDVPAGVHDMTLTLGLSDNGYLLEGFLVDPQGMELSVEGNFDPFGNPQAALQLSRFNPQPGRWSFILLQDLTSSGNQTSEPFSARIGFNTAKVTAAGLPNDPEIRLSASANPVVIPITVTNNGPVTQAYFADARLSVPVSSVLSAQLACPSPALPGTCAVFALPTEVSEVRFVAQAPVPIDMDAFNLVGYGLGGTGSPDLFAKKISTGTAVATLVVPEVPYGEWAEVPSNVGPYGASGAPPAPVSMGATAVMQPFDAAITADTGDIWSDLSLGTNTYSPLILAPGQSGVIRVTITPDGTQVGILVSGFIYVDTYNNVVLTGDEVVRIPYRYTIAQ